MRTLNGTSSNFKITINQQGHTGSTVYTFSNKFKELREYVEESYKSALSRSGLELSKFRWVKYYFEIDWSEYINTEDAMKVKAILNAEIQGKTLTLMPNLDVPKRTFKITQMKNSGGAEKKQVTQIYRNRNVVGSKGLLLTYVTVDNFSEVNWVDPETVMGDAAIACEEFN